MGSIIKMLAREWRNIQNQHLGFDQTTCDALICKYATKSLEFPVLQYEDVGMYTLQDELMLN